MSMSRPHCPSPPAPFPLHLLSSTTPVLHVAPCCQRENHPRRPGVLVYLCGPSWTCLKSTVAMTLERGLSSNMPHTIAASGNRTHDYSSCNEASSRRGTPRLTPSFFVTPYTLFRFRLLGLSLYPFLVRVPPLPSPFSGRSFCLRPGRLVDSVAARPRTFLSPPSLLHLFPLLGPSFGCSRPGPFAAPPQILQPVCSSCSPLWLVLQIIASSPSCRARPSLPCLALAFFFLPNDVASVFAFALVCPGRSRACPPSPAALFLLTPVLAAAAPSSPWCRS